MLGLARDRALVGVDPPTRLDDTWAVVMEYVDGVPLEQLLSDLGPLPVGVVVEVAQEIARSLDAIYNQRGPDGDPLQLIHRDLKPANLQLTPTGEVKILDFGIARAVFKAREAKTISGEMAGTAGYMAPERLEGLDTPAGDVYSLGTVIRRLLTGDRPVGFGGWRENNDPPPQSETRDAALELAARCQHLDPEQRPSMREVEDAAHALLRQCDDPPLRRWAERQVPPNRMLERDHRVGSILMEHDEGTPAPGLKRNESVPPPRGRAATPAPAPIRPPPPPSLPPPVTPGLKTVKPQTLYVEQDTKESDLPEAEAVSAPQRTMPLFLLAVPAGLLAGITIIILMAAVNIRNGARTARQVEDSFVQTVQLEAAAMGFAFERAGASPVRVQGDITKLTARPDADHALQLVQDWDGLINVLPPPQSTPAESDRRELRRRVGELLAQYDEVTLAQRQWAASTQHAPGLMACALGLAERPAELSSEEPPGRR